MDLFGALKTGFAQCFVDVPPPEDDGLTIGSSVFDDLYSYPDCKVTAKRRVGDPDFLVRAHESCPEPPQMERELGSNAEGAAAAGRQSNGADVDLGLAEDIQKPEFEEVSRASSSQGPASAAGEEQSPLCQDLVCRPTGASRELLVGAVEPPAIVTDCQQECEHWAMMTEDSAASCWREASGRQRSQSLPDLSYDEDESLGRIILDVRLTCTDAEGVDTLLEQNRLRLHLCQRNLDAARHFLEEQNCLKPVLVGRYLEPLAAWLCQHVASALTFPPGGIVVTGDLDAIERESRLHQS